MVHINHLQHCLSDFREPAVSVQTSLNDRDIMMKARIEHTYFALHTSSINHLRHSI